MVKYKSEQIDHFNLRKCRSYLSFFERDNWADMGPETSMDYLHTHWHMGNTLIDRSHPVRPFIVLSIFSSKIFLFQYKIMRVVSSFLSSDLLPKAQFEDWDAVDTRWQESVKRNDLCTPGLYRTLVVNRQTISICRSFSWSSSQFAPLAYIGIGMNQRKYPFRHSGLLYSQRKYATALVHAQISSVSTSAPVTDYLFSNLLFNLGHRCSCLSLNSNLRPNGEIER